MAEITLSAQTRTEFGKGPARRARREGKVPGVLYEHGTDPIHVNFPGHELMLALKNPNVLLSVDIDGKAHLAIPKQIQRDPIKGFLEHVDLLLVKRGEKVVVEVPLYQTGSVENDVLVVTEVTTIRVEAEATHIPSEIELSIDGREVGDQITAGDVVLPEGVTLAEESDILIINFVAAPTAAQVEAELDASAGEPAAEASEASEEE